MSDIQDHFHFYQLNFLVMVPLVVEQHQMVSSCLVLTEQSFLLVVAVVVGLVLVVLVCHPVVSRRGMLLVLRLVLKVLVVWLALTLV